MISKEPSNKGYKTDGMPLQPKNRERQELPLTRRTRKVIALALCCSLLGGVIGAGGFALYNNIFGGSTANDETAEGTTALLQGQRESTALKTSYVATDSEMTASQVYASNVNSTVGITTSVTTNYLGFQTTAAVSGSGFILTENGYIVTNYHVIEDASDIKVTTYDDTAYEAELIGYDEDNDLAVLKIDAKDLTPVILGDSDQINVGDSVIAIGNPLGELTFSLTQGAVSALNRKVTINNTAMTLIQTDCAINSGNSGGALFNTHGEVIGITNAKYSSSSLSGEASVDNIGFAIPINSVRENIESIIENGYVMKPYIGISVYDVDTRNQTSNLTGIAIQEVEEDSPAAAAGLKEGDIITKVNETEISSTSEFQSILSDAKEGDILTLTISRQGETVEAKVELAMRKQSALPESDTSSSKQEQTGQTPFSEGFPG